MIIWIFFTQSINRTWSLNMPHVAAKGRKKTRLNKSNKRDAVIKGAPSLFSLKPCCAIYSRFHFPFSEKDTNEGRRYPTTLHGTPLVLEKKGLLQLPFLKVCGPLLLRQSKKEVVYFDLFESFFSFLEVRRLKSYCIWEINLVSCM